MQGQCGQSKTYASTLFIFAARFIRLSALAALAALAAGFTTLATITTFAAFVALLAFTLPPLSFLFAAPVKQIV